MVEDILEVATCFLEGIGEDGQAVKGMFVVDGLGKGHHGVREPADPHQPYPFLFWLKHGIIPVRIPGTKAPLGVNSFKRPVW
jgi:hypothetical protein